MQTTIKWRDESKRVRVTAVTSQVVVVSYKRRARVYDIKTGKAMLPHDMSRIDQRSLQSIKRST